MDASHSNTQNSQTSPGKHRSKTFLRLILYVKPYTWKLFLSLFLLVLGTASDVLGPIIIKVFIDQNLTPGIFPPHRILFLASAYLLLIIGSSAFNYIQLVSFQTIALEIIRQIRIDMFAKVQHLGLSYFDRTPVGTLISRITNDTEAIKDLFVSVLSTFIQNLIQLVGIFISMFVLDAHLASFLSCSSTNNSNHYAYVPKIQFPHFSYGTPSTKPSQR